ncbi:MAG TPA: plastocyanin/azurin family copper-binding protein [Solirubrobacteraceae bacterium]|nr:plastocyanin/azurin family copper-binding protein [Solirubrobacteraceae bacterium]
MIALAGVLLALVVAACGDDKESNTGRDAGDNGATVTTNPTPQAPTSTQSGAEQSGDIVSVGMKDIKFVPKEIEAKVGQKIVWTNNEAIPHNVTATDGADFASDTLQKDDTFEYTAEKAGTIKYVCTIHEGQNGQITVTQ